MTKAEEVVKNANLSNLIRTTYDYQLAEAIRNQLIKELREATDAEIMPILRT